MSDTISTVIVQKNPFTMSKTDDRQMPKARYRRRNMCDGKLVAYILEVEISERVVEPIGIEPMT